MLDVSETDAEYLVRADLPAVKKEDVSVTVENDAVTIAGERKFDKEEKSERVHRRESFRGLFSRSLSLPDNVDANGIRAESKDGVLTVHIPKTKSERLPAHGGTADSLNWSGYAVTPTGGGITAVSSTFTVPTAGLVPPGFAATWTGIGGYNTSDLIQAGTAE